MSEKKKLILGVDNGTSGTMALLTEEGEVLLFIETPKKIEQSYTKAKQNISRVDTVALREILSKYRSEEYRVVCVIERPLVNPRLFKTTLSAMRALEATLCLIEEFGFSRMYCDSKQWQKVLLPAGLKGSEEQKKASMDIGIRLFPEHKELISKHKDADGLLIAEWARRAQL